MRTHWMLATVITAALTTGCGGSAVENGQNDAEIGVPAPGDETVAASPGASPQVGTAATPDAQGNPATPAGRAPAPPTRLAPAESAAPVPARPTFRDVVVPAGTALSLELITALSSDTAQVEAPVRARLREAVDASGATVLPAGAVLSGNVTAVERAGRVRGRSHLEFRFTEVELPDGPQDLRTNVISFEGEATRGEDATKIGVGAGVGAIVGGVLGGGDGAAKGAAIGGAAGTGAVLATRGRAVELAPGATLATTLAEPVSVRVR